MFRALPEDPSPASLADRRSSPQTNNAYSLPTLIVRSFVHPVTYIFSALSWPFSNREAQPGNQQVVKSGSTKRSSNAKNKVPSLTRPSPYAKLKSGKKHAIVAVVDNGTISFQKFGMTDFTELPWVGDGGSESWERDMGPSLA